MPAGCIPLSHSRSIRKPKRTRTTGVTRTDTIAIVLRRQRLINKPVQGPQANRRDVLIAVLEFGEQVFNCENISGLRALSGAWFTDFPCRLCWATLAEDGIEVHGGGNEVYVASDVCRKMILITS